MNKKMKLTALDKITFASLPRETFFSAKDVGCHPSRLKRLEKAGLLESRINKSTYHLDYKVV